MHDVRLCLCKKQNSVILYISKAADVHAPRNRLLIQALICHSAYACSVTYPSAAAVSLLHHQLELLIDAVVLGLGARRQGCHPGGTVALRGAIAPGPIVAALAVRVAAVGTAGAAATLVLLLVQRLHKVQKCQALRNMSGVGTQYWFISRSFLT